MDARSVLLRTGESLSLGVGVGCHLRTRGAAGGRVKARAPRSAVRGLGRPISGHPRSCGGFVATKWFVEFVRNPLIPRESQTVGRHRLVELDRDHPGFTDADYRRRRDEIARLALEYVEGDPVPRISYTEQEHDVWRTVWSRLQPLFTRYAAREVHEGVEAARLSTERVPQLEDVNQLLVPTGFRMLPVAGLIDGGVFLGHLGRGIFLSTQYMRHHSRPLYTPEPDVIHELVGHAMTLVHPLFAELNRWFGQAVEGMEDVGRLRGMLRAYWYTLEFGAVREGDTLKVLGAGLLSSFGELGRFETEAQLRPLDLEDCAARPFDPTDYQSVIYVAESMTALRDALQAFLLDGPRG